MQEMQKMMWFDTWVRKTPWRKAWQPTPVFLPEESHRQRSLAGYSPCCCCCWVASVMSNSVRPLRQQPTRLPHPWDSPGKNTGVGCHFLLQCMEVKSESEVAQLYPTLSDPMDCSPPGFSVHRIFQARVLEWGAIAFSYYQPRQHIKEQRHYFANKGPSSSRLWFFQ